MYRNIFCFRFYFIWKKVFEMMISSLCVKLYIYCTPSWQYYILCILINEEIFEIIVENGFLVRKTQKELKKIIRNKYWVF